MESRQDFLLAGIDQLTIYRIAQSSLVVLKAYEEGGIWYSAQIMSQNSHTVLHVTEPFSEQGEASMLANKIIEAARSFVRFEQTL